MKKNKEENTINSGNLFSFPSSKVVSAIGVDESGSQIVLAGKQGLHIVDIDNPSVIKRTLTIPTTPSSPSREQICKNIQWNPHSSRKTLIASSNGKNINLWDAGSNSNRGGIVSTLSSHSRTVQGISWNFKDENLLASCSLDTYVNIWDTRTARNSLKIRTYCSWTDGGIDVKWNRQNGVILASCHSGEVRVWDIRKETTPLTFITAHNTKINNIDWSYIKEHDLLTCGMDKKVKIWNVTIPRITKGTLKTPQSVVFSRYTPLGEGVITIEKENNLIKLWKLADLTSSVHTYTGHNDAIISYDFAVNKEKSYCKIVTFARNSQIGFWNISSSHLKSIGDYSSYREENNSKEEIVGDDDDDEEEFNLISKFKLTSSVSIMEEFSLLDTINFPNVQFEERNIAERKIIFAVQNERSEIVMQIKLPDEYPNGVNPSFTILSSTLPARIQPQILQTLTEISQRSVEKSIPCIDQAITYVEQFIQVYSQFSNSNNNSNNNTSRENAGSIVTSSSIGSSGNSNNTINITSTPTPSSSHHTSNPSLNNDSANFTSLETSDLNHIEIALINDVIFNRSKKKELREHYELPCPRLAGAIFTLDGSLMYFHNFYFFRNIQPPQTYDGLLAVLEDKISSNNKAVLSSEDKQHEHHHHQSSGGSNSSGGGSKKSTPSINISNELIENRKPSDHHQHLTKPSDLEESQNDIYSYYYSDDSYNQIHTTSDAFITDNTLSHYNNINNFFHSEQNGKLEKKDLKKNKVKAKQGLANTKVMFSKSLGPYIFDISLALQLKVTGGNFQELCTQNAGFAAQFRRKDLQQVWQLVSLIAEPFLDANFRANSVRFIEQQDPRDEADFYLRYDNDDDEEDDRVDEEGNSSGSADDEYPFHHSNLFDESDRKSGELDLQFKRHRKTLSPSELTKIVSPDDSKVNINNNNNNNNNNNYAEKLAIAQLTSTSSQINIIPNYNQKREAKSSFEDTSSPISSSLPENIFIANPLKGKLNHKLTAKVSDNSSQTIYNKYSNQVKKTYSKQLQLKLYNANSMIRSWVNHPFGSSLLQNIFDHFEKLKDLQTLAVLSCVIASVEGNSYLLKYVEPSPPQLKRTSNLIAPSTPSSENHSTNSNTTTGNNNANTYFEYLNDNFDHNNATDVHEEIDRAIDQANQENYILPPSPKYCEFIKNYSELLYRFGEVEKAVEIHKIIEMKSSHSGLDFGVLCKECGRKLSHLYCYSCKKKGFYCSICNMPVNGLSTFCLYCGHGGHTKHMKEWFSKEDVCASGCGCRCLQNHQYTGGISSQAP